MSTNKEFYEWLKVVRRRCVALAFVMGTSVGCFDDDHMRGHSKEIDLDGFRSHVDANKGEGITFHGFVDIHSGLYLGGHIPNRNQGQIESMKEVLKDLLFAENWDELKNGAGFNGMWIALDRLYVTIPLAIMLKSVGMHIIGTFRRNMGGPFDYWKKEEKYKEMVQREKTVGKNNGSNKASNSSKKKEKRIIQVKGQRATYIGTKYYPVEKSQIQFCIGGHRTGLGNAFLTFTSIPELINDNYVITWRNPNALNHDTISVDDPDKSTNTFYLYERNCVRLSSDQSTDAGWFLNRMFCFTSTGK